MIKITKRSDLEIPKTLKTMQKCIFCGHAFKINQKDCYLITFEKPHAVKYSCECPQCKMWILFQEAK